jgi:8-oxo-dGTP pyrophosphatase MutT (NUDIX family)
MTQFQSTAKTSCGGFDIDGIKEMISQNPMPKTPEPFPFKPTCVFLLLFNPDDPYILAIQKTDSEGYPWRNQVALPGGHLEDGDASPLDGAFRELEEETRISRHQVEFIGSLGHYQTINGRDIEAFIGMWDGTGPVRYDPSEIARILHLPLRSLIQTHHAGNFHNRIPSIDELRYPIEDTVVWGATARILHQLIELLYPLLAKTV